MDLISADIPIVTSIGTMFETMYHPKMIIARGYMDVNTLIRHEKAGTDGRLFECLSGSIGAEGTIGFQ